MNVPALWGGHVEGLINATVCRYGEATRGPHCGSITGLNVSQTIRDLDDNDHLLHNLIRTDACQRLGDSGGPLITTSNKQAQGTLVGGFDGPCPGISTGSFFEPVTKHMAIF
jgi:hypothetical protein